MNCVRQDKKLWISVPLGDKKNTFLYLKWTEIHNFPYRLKTTFQMGKKVICEPKWLELLLHCFKSSFLGLKALANHTVTSQQGGCLQVDQIYR